MKENFFEIQEYKARIELLEKRFSRYMNNSVTKETIVEYILQFSRFVPIEDQKLMFLGVLEVLEQIDFWDMERLRLETGELVQKIMSKCGNEYVFCGLGNEGGSGFRLLKMLPLEYRQNNYLLESVLSENDCPQNLVFVDDAISSGKQVVEIFQEWLGVPVDKRELGRNYVKELPDKAKKILKKSKVYLGCFLFKTENEKYILEKLKHLGIENAEIVHLKEFCKIFKTKYTSNETAKMLAERCFFEVGKKIMFAAYTPREDTENVQAWTNRKLEYAALGYSDAQQTIVYEYNVPTYTLTALWKSVNTPCFVWEPLFTRKKSSEEI